MSLNDIYRATFHYELPTSAASWSLYYKEDIDASGGDIDTEILADAIEVNLASVTVDLLAADCAQSAITVEKVFGVKEAKHRIDIFDQVGARPGASLPNNHALVFGLVQTTFTPKSNGRIFVPGLSELDSSTGVVTAAFQAAQQTAFITELVKIISELSGGTGRFQPGVISAKVRDLVPPAKDWAGAFAPITAIFANTVIGIMRKRGTKAVGRAI